MIKIENKIHYPRHWEYKDVAAIQNMMHSCDKCSRLYVACAQKKWAPCTWPEACVKKKP